MHNDTLNRFINLELNSSVRLLFNETLQEKNLSPEIKIREFNLNMFNVIFDFEKNTVYLEDALSDSVEDSTEIPMPDFFSICDLISPNK